MTARILLAGLLWLLCDALELLRDSVEISREALLRLAGWSVGL